MVDIKNHKGPFLRCGPYSASGSCPANSFRPRPRPRAGHRCQAGGGVVSVGFQGRTTSVATSLHKSRDFLPIDFSLGWSSIQKTCTVGPFQTAEGHVISLSLYTGHTGSSPRQVFLNKLVRRRRGVPRFPHILIGRETLLTQDTSPY